MAAILLLEGSSGVGKSTLLLEEIRRRKLIAGGYLSVRLNDLSGQTRAFCLQPYQEAKGSIAFYTGSEANIFLKVGEPDSKKRGAAVFGRIREVAGKAQGAQLTVLDEVGGLELLVPEFQVYLDEVLEGDQDCLGVLKSAVNFERMWQRIGADPQLKEYYQQLRNRLEEQQVQILTVRADNREEIRHQVGNFLDRAGRSGR